ncbi:hypothetical protein FB45DRAFT_887444 [Roridomyces roridus]|uniref:F-box domain-containing protein n=1 Tax=Roridomyces roridus TaxID=1738132 RepID=A0AAD7CJJ3_9AGAR|nr:hypothetical protein FB45DRAFT_887444 [Roridomyces roridus]
MSRRSTRLASIGTPITVDGDREDREDDESVEINDEEPPKKKRKVSSDSKTKKVRGRRGILSSLKEFPLDVMFEILGHLRLQDLLTLSRTTKDFRGLLMSRSSATIWKESRSRVEGLPDIPKDLSEPQYANLVFDSHCHECLAPSAKTVVWIVRLRLCKKCVQQHLVDHDGIAAILDESLLDLVPSFREHRGRVLLFPKAFASQLSQESEAFKADNVIQIDRTDYVEWRKRKREEVDKLNTHATACANWLANRVSDRSEELDGVRESRLEAIVDRLTALGWGAEIHRHWDFRYHKLVRQPKLLTDRIWANIKAPLIEFLTQKKTSRLEQEKRNIIQKRRHLAVKAYSDFVASLPFGSITPPKYEVLCTEPFRELIEDTSIHPHEEITLESFAEAISELPEFCTDWRESKDEELVDILKEFKPKATEETLSLATTFFRIDGDPRQEQEPIGYPRILVHRAAIPYHSNLFPTIGEMPSLASTIHGGAWNANKMIRPDLKASPNVRAVVRACNLDPKVTTVDEMDELNPVMECVTCASTAGRLVMRWIHAAKHSCHAAGRDAVWKRLQPEEELDIEELEKRNFKAFLESLQTVARYGFGTEAMASYECNLCLDSEKAWTLPRLAEHVKTTHEQDELVMEHGRCKVDTNIGQRYPRPFRWVQ